MARKHYSEARFSPAFFSKGTIAVVKAYSHSDGKIIGALRIKLEVQKLSKNSPDNYVITGKPLAHIGYVPKENAKPETYSILNVLEITYRAPGVAMIDEGGASALFKEFWKNQNYWANEYGWIKHSSYYDVSAFNDLVMYVSDKYTKQDELVDIEKLVDMILDTHIVKYIIPESVSMGELQHYRVSKKKLHATVKRFLPKCRVKAYTAQLEYDKDIQEAMSTSDNRADIIFDTVSTLRHFEMTPETVRLVTELNDGVFGKGSWEGGLASRQKSEGDEDLSEIGDPNSLIFATPIVRGYPKDDQNKPLSLGDLLKQKFDQMAKDVVVFDEADVLSIEARKSLVARQKLISEVAEGLPKTVFIKLPQIDDDELLSDKTTYIDDGETEEGNFTSHPNKKD